MRKADPLAGAISLMGVLLFARLLLALLDARLGPLPAGAELLLWAYAVAAWVAAISLGVWSLRSGRGFGSGLLGGYTAMLIAGLLTLVFWLGLFYGAGTYEKGGYGRLIFGLLALVLTTAGALVIAARLVVQASRRDIPQVAAFVGLVLLGLLAGLVVLPTIFS